MADEQPTHEQWRPIPGYEGFYEVSDHGRVRSVDRVVTAIDGRSMRYSGKMLSGKVDKHGRHMVALSRPGHRTRTPLIHRLVLEAFVGPRPEGMECCHWDDDKTNNHLSNLRWDTKKANARDALRNGRNSNAAKTHCPAGHPYDDVNTFQSERGRDCRECGRESRNRRYREAREAAMSSGVWAPRLGGVCPKGHGYTAENTYTYPDGKKRACVTCQRAASRESARRYRARNPEKVRAQQRAWRERQRGASS